MQYSDYSNYVIRKLSNLFKKPNLLPQNLCIKDQKVTSVSLTVLLLTEEMLYRKLWTKDSPNWMQKYTLYINL